MRKRATVANAPALEAYLAWVRGGEGWPRVDGEACPTCATGEIVLLAGDKYLQCTRRFSGTCNYRRETTVDGVRSALRKQVLAVGDTSQRSRWRNGRRSPGTAYRAELARLTQNTHTPIPFQGWPGDRGYGPRAASKKRAA